MSQTKSKTIILLFVVGIIVGSIWYLEMHQAHGGGNTGPVVSVTSVDSLATSTLIDTSSSPSSVAPSDVKTSLMTLAATDKAAGFSLAKEITQPSGFINTGTDASGNPLPITISQYIGKKVILIDFWTYSCINCQRTTPYLNTWYSKYEDKGLVIIGVHTPEFDFEKVYANVSAAVKKEGIQYPVVMDSNYGTWTAYQNQYWPHKYLIDVAGYMVADYIGEGSYDQTEQKIQNLLMQRARILGSNTSGIDTAITTPVGAVTTIQAQSPETYFGSARNEYLANGNAGVQGTQIFTLPTSFDTNSLYLGGIWNVQNQEADATGDVTIKYVFNAKELYFVAGSIHTNGSDITVLLDGKPVAQAGKDIVTTNGKTTVHVTGDRLYHLIDLPKAGVHTLEIHAQAGLKAFTFTFG